jgi:VCBS repeat-containing protein
VTITGTNDAPTITAIAGTTDLVGAITEDASSPLTDTGILTFDDVDLTDTHSVSATKASGTLGGSLSLGSVIEAANTSAGSVAWTYSLANSAAQYLSVGQTATEIFTVTINDNNGGTTTQSVSITITGTNDAPTITSGSTGTVAENASTSTVIYTASASDVDASDTRTYSLAASADYASLTINASTGAVTLNTSADYETKSSYSFTVIARDTGGLTAQQNVIVSVSNVNDAPIFNPQAQAFTYTDTAAPDTFSATSGTFSATDADANTTLTYGISGVTASNGVATLVGTYGSLAVTTATGAYTFTPNSTAINAASTTTSEAYTVTVSDGSATANLSYTVNVTGAAESAAPVNSFSTSVVVNAGQGGTITQVANASGGYDWVHSFTNTGTSTFVAPNADVSAQILVVGGGGGGGANGGGGGGGGGVIFLPDTNLSAYSVNSIRFSNLASTKSP